MANLTVSADIAIVDGNVDARPIEVGEAVTKFMPVYVDPQTGKYLKCIATSAAAAKVAAIIWTAASTDGYAMAFFPGARINLASAFTAGDVHVVSATAGLVADIGDLTSGQFQQVLGQAESANIFHFNPTTTVVEI